MIIHQKRLIPTSWLTEQNNKLSNYKYLATLENKSRVVFAGDSIIDYFPIDQLINRRAINRGVSGFTSNQLVDNLKPLILDLSPDVLVLCIGANDCYYRLSKDETVSNIKKVCTEAIDNNKKIKIIVMSLLPTDNRKDYLTSYFNEVNKALLSALKDISNVIFLDMFDKFKDGGRGKQELYMDGLHPNARGYNIIASEINKII